MDIAAERWAWVAHDGARIPGRLQPAKLMATILIGMAIFFNA
jgi:hypothetical protein